MKTAQLVIWESSTRWTTPLEGFVAEMSWLLRRARDAEQALDHLRTGGVGVLLIELGENPEEPLRLLAEAARHDWPIIVTAHEFKRDLGYRRQWSDLLYDLGASLVLFPPLAKTTMEDAIAGLMEATISRFGAVEKGTSR